jgi:hypothetical protein
MWLRCKRSVLLGMPRRRWEGNIKMDIRKQFLRMAGEWNRLSPIAGFNSLFCGVRPSGSARREMVIY